MSIVIAAAPALPLHTAGKYVAGAYVVFVALVLVYVAIMARRLARAERELAELRRLAAGAPDAARDASKSHGAGRPDAGVERELEPAP